MTEYRIEVKPWMLKSSTPGYDFMAKWNNDIPMPLLVMYGTKIGESPKMTKFKLHGDIQQRITTTCMCCGRPITNKISQYFGIGPVCGGHNYTSPFATEEELDKAIAGYRAKLVNKTWIGWIPNNSIISVDGNTDVIQELADMPFEVVPESEYYMGGKSNLDTDYDRSLPVIRARIAKPVKGTDDFSVFLSFRYNEEAKDAVKNLRVHIWNNDTKEWEIEYKEFDTLKETLPGFRFEVSGEEMLPQKVGIEDISTFKTAPMSHQLEGVVYGLNHNRWLLADDQGLGKALALDTKVYTPNGYKHMGDIRVGDYVFGRDGSPTRVIAVYDHTNVEMYRITFSDGASIECCKDHLWKIYDKKGSKVVDTNWFMQKDQFGAIRKDNLKGKDCYKYWIDRCEPVKFDCQNIPVDAYVLGALLGDGSLTSNSVGFTTADKEMVSNINKRLPSGYTLKSSGSMKDIEYNIVGVRGRKNEIKQSLIKMGLWKTNSHNKFIPNIYKYNSVKVRTEVLQGLIDTDGYATKDNLLSFTTVSKQLCEDVKFLVESLGGIVSYSEKKCGYEGKITSTAYTLTVKFDNPQLYCSLSRKKVLLKPRKFKPRRSIVSVERISNADARCITVDNAEHLYIIDHFVVTHNTKQLIDLAIARKNAGQVNHCLIICGVNSLKWNWIEEIKKHSDEDGWILGMYRKNYKTNNQTWDIGSNQDKLNDLNKLGSDPHLDSHFFLITNIESLRNVEIADKLAELCDTGIISMVAVDEVHRVRNTKTQAGQGLLKLQPTYRVAMTGTPLINNPLDLYAILKWLGYQRYGFKSFKNHFCNSDDWGGISSYKNIDQLQDQLDSIMLRRKKDEVLDLPDKIYVNEYVELTDEQKRLYNQVIADALESKENKYSDEKECILATLLKLRQVSGGIGAYDFIKKNPKLDRLEQLVEEAVYSGTKVIVYSNWVEGIKPALARLKKYNPVVITGETKDADRQSIVNQFQTDDTVKVILGTIGALGTGLTLTAATEVIFLDEPWNEATKEQACDRAYRIGTTSNVTIHTIMTHGTYDEDVHLIVEGKGDLAHAIVDKDDLAMLKIA